MTALDLASLPWALHWRTLAWLVPTRLFDGLLDQPFYSNLLGKGLQHAGFKDGACVLELGCGPGALGSIPATKGMKLTGCDRSKAMLGRARARRQTSYAQLIQSEATHLPFPDHSFDGAFCASVLQLVDDPGACLNELGRVLVPGATLLIAAPEGHFDSGAAERLMEEHTLVPKERSALRLWARSGRRLGSQAVSSLVGKGPFHVTTIRSHLSGTMYSLCAVRKEDTATYTACRNETKE